MEQAQDGDHDAYAALLDDISPALQQFVSRRVRDPDDAKDAYQDVLMAVHGARHTYQPGRPLEPWLFAIARRVIGHRYGERGARESREVLMNVQPDVAIEGNGLLKLELEQALLALSPTEREALALLKLDGLSVAAAASRAGTTIAALKVRAHRAYRTLRRLL